MEISYKPLILGALITGAVAISYLVQPGTATAPQPTQTPTQDNLEKILKVETSIQELKTPPKYVVFYPEPLNVDPGCLFTETIELERKSGDVKIIPRLNLFEDLLFGFEVEPEEYGEKYKDDLMGIGENCKE
ncbi:MAG: hypothetical protein IH934_06380 [Nanoarchaeota archaeon]|nr:hypothetical protein [Nanoarchaeota archaeon]